MKSKWSVGKIYKIVGYNQKGDERILRRLLEFGFTRGESFVISHKSMFGKVGTIEIRGFCLSFRLEFLNILKVA